MPNQRTKQFDLFKPRKNSIISSIQRNINDILQIKETKSIEKYMDSNDSIKIIQSIKKKRNENYIKNIKLESYSEKANNVFDKEKIRDILKSQKLNFPKI